MHIIIASYFKYNLKKTKNSLKMEVKKEDSISIDSNSCSLVASDESKLKTNRKKPIKTGPRKKRYPKRKVAHIPKRYFDQINKKLKKNKPFIDLKSQTIEKETCERFISSHLNGEQMNRISPESVTRLLWEMRNSLQRREYSDLAKLISMFTEMPIGKQRWYATLSKYCLIELLYDPLVKGTGLLDLFLEGVIGCQSEIDKKSFLADINRMPNNIHVTKYDDLWLDYPHTNQLNQSNLNKLCELLNKRSNAKHDPESYDDEEWESFDENDDSSGSETCESTEAEQPCDLHHEIAELEFNFNI